MNSQEEGWYEGTHLQTLCAFQRDMRVQASRRVKVAYPVKRSSESRYPEVQIDAGESVSMDDPNDRNFKSMNIGRRVMLRYCMTTRISNPRAPVSLSVARTQTRIPEQKEWVARLIYGALDKTLLFAKWSVSSQVWSSSPSSHRDTISMRQQRENEE